MFPVGGNALASGQVGTAANRPAAGSVPKGYLYYATDTNALSESDGVSVWTTVVTGGGGAAALTSKGCYVGFQTAGAPATPTTANTTIYGRAMAPVALNGLTKMGAGVTATSGNYAQALYGDDGTGQNPGTRTVTSGSVAVPATGLANTTIASTNITAGAVWLALGVDNGTAAFNYVGSGGAGGPGACRSRQESNYPPPATATPSGFASFTFGAWAEIL